MNKEKTFPDFKYEQWLISEGYRYVAGVDEAGRGPLCGPVCAAAVILPENAVIEGINDSKKLSEKKREELFSVITETAIAYGIAYATPEEIDSLNILNATMLAMNRACDMMSVRPDILLIDGNCSRGIKYNARTLVKGDSKSISVAAASILAKVSRDRLLEELDKKYPQYNLAKHKGYPTKEHIELVRKYRPNEIYRKSFLKKII